MNQLTNLFKVLSDETRLRILILLSKEELCVCQLSGILEVTQPNISKHLSKLRDLGYVSDERRDKFVFYRLIKENGSLISVLNDICGNLDQYPRLTADRERLADKEIYLNQCCGTPLE